MPHLGTHVEGKPATFATKGERPWKDALAAAVPLPSLGGEEKGLTLDFTVASLAPNGHPLDVENLCEPVFSVLVNRVGWFGGSRPRIRWWRATKQQGANTGCAMIISTEGTP